MPASCRRRSHQVDRSEAKAAATEAVGMALELRATTMAAAAWEMRRVGSRVSGACPVGPVGDTVAALAGPRVAAVVAWLEA